MTTRMGNTLNRRQKKAFTLLEIVLAMALMSIISLTLYSAVRIASNPKKATKTALSPYRSIEPLCESLRRDIVCACVPTGTLAGDFESEDDSDGDYDKDSLTFYTTSYQSTDDDAVACNIAKVTYSIGVVETQYLNSDTAEDGSDSYGLVREILTNPLSTETDDLVIEVICRGVVSLNFEFYDGSDWVDSWNSTNQDDSLPEAVKVEVSLGEKKLDDSEDLIKYCKIFLLSCFSEELEEGRTVDIQ